MSQSTEDEDAVLKDLVAKTLASNGALGKFQAQLRATVFLALEEEFKDRNLPLCNVATQNILASPAGVFAASLVYDFLVSLGMDFTLGVFEPESNLNSGFWKLLERKRLLQTLKLSSGFEGAQSSILIKFCEQYLSSNEGLDQVKNSEKQPLVRTQETPNSNLMETASANSNNSIEKKPGNQFDISTASSNISSGSTAKSPSNETVALIHINLNPTSATKLPSTTETERSQSDCLISDNSAAFQNSAKTPLPKLEVCSSTKTTLPPLAAATKLNVKYEENLDSETLKSASNLSVNVEKSSKRGTSEHEKLTQQGHVTSGSSTAGKQIRKPVTLPPENILTVDPYHELRPDSAGSSSSTSEAEVHKILSKITVRNDLQRLKKHPSNEVAQEPDDDHVISEDYEDDDFLSTEDSSNSPSSSAPGSSRSSEPHTDAGKASSGVPEMSPVEEKQDCEGQSPVKGASADQSMAAEDKIPETASEAQVLRLQSPRELDSDSLEEDIKIEGFCSDDSDTTCEETQDLSEGSLTSKADYTEIVQE